jgi:AcrR family transcriptional regulator
VSTQQSVERGAAQPKQRRKQSATRERILTVAFDLFVERGFDGTTISEVERRVGLAVGTGSLNYHFKTKEELLRAAVEHEVSVRMAEVDAARRATTWPEGDRDRRIAAAAMALNDIRRFDRLFRLMQAEGERLPDLQKLAAESLAELGGIGSWLQEPSRLLAITALIGFHTLHRGALGVVGSVSDEDFIAALVDALPENRPVGFPAAPAQQSPRQRRRSK